MNFGIPNKTARLLYFPEPCMSCACPFLAEAVLEYYALCRVNQYYYLSRRILKRSSIITQVGHSLSHDYGPRKCAITFSGPIYNCLRRKCYRSRVLLRFRNELITISAQRSSALSFTIASSSAHHSAPHSRSSTSLDR